MLATANRRDRSGSSPPGYVGRRRTDAHHGRGESGGGLHRVGVVAPGAAVTAVAGDGFGHEHHVDVAGVVELTPAALAHRDHRETTTVDRSARLGPGDRQRRLQRCPGEVRELGRHVGDISSVANITRGKTEQMVAIAHAEQVGGHADRSGRHRHDNIRISLYADQQAPSQPRGRGPDVDIQTQQPPRDGALHQVLGQRLARTEHSQQAASQLRVVSKGCRQRVGSCHPRRLSPRRLGRQEVGKSVQGGVRIGGGRELRQQVAAVLQGVQRIARKSRKRAVGLGEAEPNQAGGDGAPPARRLGTHLAHATGGPARDGAESPPRAPGDTGPARRP